MSFSEITIDELNKSIADKKYLNGFYTVKFDDGVSYKGKIINSSAYGYGIMYNDNNNGIINDTDIIYDGIWIKGNPIDYVSLPDLTNQNELDVTNTCEKIKFTYKNLDKTKKDSNGEYIVDDEFDLEYYVPFLSDYDLNAVKEKAIAQTEWSFNDIEINVEVTNMICDLETIDSALKVANDLNNVSKYIMDLDYECSNCQSFNRGWVCCGQFAPYLYIYYTLLSGNNYDNFISNKSFNKEKEIRKPTYINDLAVVFYKVFTGYGLDNKEYHDVIDKIQDEYLVSIPNVLNDDSYWYKEFKASYTINDFENNKSYLLNIIDDYRVYHYSFIHRYNNYIIICDSWSDDNKRFPVTRIVDINVFIKCLNKLNTIYTSKNIYDKNKLEDKEQQIKDMLLYNFIIDTLFLVPYYSQSISNSIQSFYPDTISELRIVDPSVIEEVFGLLNEKNGKPFHEYLMMGGFRNKRGKKQSKKRKNKVTKKRKNKRNKNKSKSKKLMRK